MLTKIPDRLQSYPTLECLRRKLDLFYDAIRGKDVTTALGIVTYNPRYASSVVKKLLESAIANAENNNGLSRENLYVAECFANKAPTMKRIHPRAQGQSLQNPEEKQPHHDCVRREIRRTCHGTES